MNHPLELTPFTLEIVGEVKLNNLSEIMPMIREGLATINRQPTTDEEFGQAELDVKKIKGAEDALKAAKDKAISDAASIQDFFKSIDDASKELAAARLELEKVIALKKEEVKTSIVDDALATFDIDSMDARRSFAKPLQEVMKGKRTLDSMRTACRVYAATQQAMIAKNRKAIETFEKAHGPDMTLDRRELELKSGEYVEGELRRRFEAKKAHDERKRLEAEAAEQKAAAAKAQAELAAAKAPDKPEPLPAPPKIGSIPTGSKAVAPGGSNVVPFSLEPEPSTISEADEWNQFFATIKAAFSLIREHKMRLTHERNETDASELGAVVNAWSQSVRAKREVAS